MGIAGWGLRYCLTLQNILQDLFDSQLQSSHNFLVVNRIIAQSVLKGHLDSRKTGSSYPFLEEWAVVRFKKHMTVAENYLKSLTSSLPRAYRFFKSHKASTQEKYKEFQRG